jgi:hypothetical protein
MEKGFYDLLLRKQERGNAQQDGDIASEVRVDYWLWPLRRQNCFNGQWYLIKEGARWRTNSIAADDYIKQCLWKDYVVKNVPMETLQQFSEVGEIYPHLEFTKM